MNILLQLLAILRALQWSHQTAHWKVRGEPFYGDHLLFQKLYEAVGEEIDTLAEKNKKLGRDNERGGLAELVRFRDLVKANGTLIESTEALNAVMLSLSNIGGLNAETMADMQAEGSATYAKLIKANPELVA
jgi:DNA-binding ferritin-like protein